jgi:hypothetical protein
MMKQILIAVALALLTVTAASQTILNPNYGLKSPRSAGLVKVTFAEGSTEVEVSITSEIDNAWFCIDRNTYIVRPDGMRLKLKGLKGLPYCPATHRFSKPGEKVTVTLTFPPTGVMPWFSIVEECGEGCLSFRGVVTDSDLNRKLDEAYALIDRGEEAAAYGIFEQLLTVSDSLNTGIEGALFSTLVTLDHKSGRMVAAKRWYERMLTSGAPDLGLYLESLRVQGIEF